MWKCSVCERENSDTAVCCQCGYDKSKDYRHYFVLSPLSEKVRKSWSSNQPGNKYLKDWNEWSESLKKEFRLFDDVEAKWFLNEMKNRCDGLLDQAKNIKKEAQRLIKKHFPGALTLVVEKSENTPDYITSGMNTVGIRIPDKILIVVDFPAPFCPM